MASNVTEARQMEVVSALAGSVSFDSPPVWDAELDE